MKYRKRILLLLFSIIGSSAFGEVIQFQIKEENLRNIGIVSMNIVLYDLITDVFGEEEAGAFSYVKSKDESKEDDATVTFTVRCGSEMKPEEIKTKINLVAIGILWGHSYFLDKMHQPELAELRKISDDLRVEENHFRQKFITKIISKAISSTGPGDGDLARILLITRDVEEQ